ncbi:hypothetical protein LLG90_26085, partial [Aromatoleum toluclasticum]|uniref:hypothetical protein n=1 Tax=Aromatoleum toluclasticum TaxID=92003 RepID=UPI001D17DF5C
QTLDLGTPSGRRGLVAWWIRAQVSDAGLRGLMPEAALSEVDPSLPQDAPLPLTRGLHAAWLAREDLRQTLDLGTPSGRRELMAWWIRAQVSDAGLRGLMPEAALSEVDPSLPQDAPLPLTRGL